MKGIGTFGLDLFHPGQRCPVFLPQASRLAGELQIDRAQNANAAATGTVGLAGSNFLRERALWVRALPPKDSRLTLRVLQSHACLRLPLSRLRLPAPGTPRNTG